MIFEHLVQVTETTQYFSELVDPDESNFVPITKIMVSAVVQIFDLNIS